MATDLSAYRLTGANGGYEMMFAVDHVACGGCVAKIERGLKDVPGLDHARVNLTDKRLLIGWHGDDFDPAIVPDRLRAMGFDGRPFRLATHAGDSGSDADMGPMLRYLAVAFFGAMNIMLLSISVWSGNASDIAQETRDLFHWVSALIALPVAAYAGQPFYRSAWRALRSGHVNMDVPITLGVMLALMLSLYETAHSARHAYFDSAVMLLFFLLAGRTLDGMMRARARKLTANLLALRGQNARRLAGDGSVIEVPVSALAAGDRILVAQGERVGADGIVESGTSELDQSLITGETVPANVTAGERAYAGALNLGGALTVRIERARGRDLVEEIEQLRARAMAVKDRRIVLADRAARYYAPFVHSAAALTFLGWLLATGSVHTAAVTAIAVLIITCPCALGLAIPAVHVAASSALMRKGVLLQEGDALERVADCDVAVFDKTGTLTLPDMDMINGPDIPQHLLAGARRLARSSRHPVAQALLRGADHVPPFPDTEEIAGQGVRVLADGRERRLGSPAFAGVEAEAAALAARHPGATALGYSDGHESCVFLFAQKLRPGAAKVMARLEGMGLRLAILSGDNEAAVSATARAAGIADWRAGLLPGEKIDALKELAAAGHRMLMIGDGINDAPALAQAHASLAPASASQITQASADALFLGEGLGAVSETISRARQARTLMNQNLLFATVYNLFAIPLAVAGLVTPLIAAAAMSLSSIVVSLNAARAGGWERKKTADAGADVHSTQAVPAARLATEGQRS